MREHGGEVIRGQTGASSSYWYDRALPAGGREHEIVLVFRFFDGDAGHIVECVGSRLEETADVQFIGLGGQMSLGKEASSSESVGGFWFR